MSIRCHVMIVDIEKMASAQKKPCLDLSREETERFINVYLSHVNLWDVSSKEYSTRDKRAASLTSISLSFPDKALTTEQVTSKIANIRSSYARELKKQLNSKSSGAATDDIYTPSWEYFLMLDPFLRPCMRQRPSVSNLYVQELPKDQLQDAVGDAGGDEEVTEATEEVGQIEMCEMGTVEVPKLCKSNQKQITSTKNSLDKFREAIVKSLNKIGSNSSESAPNQQFLSHLGQEMLAVTDRKLLRELKFDLQKVVFEYQVKQENLNEP